MRQKATRLVVALGCAVLMGGCAGVGHGPIMAPLQIDLKGPVAAGSAAGRSKVGRAEAQGWLIYATGDASITAAMRRGGITRIHHVDVETTNYFGFYTKVVTIVYGE